MKSVNRILLTVGCALLLIVSWITAISAKNDTQLQAELLEQSDVYYQDEIYIRCVPLLEQAASYHGNLTDEAESRLKDVYLKLIDQKGYPRKYTELLEREMARTNAPASVFSEAAHYYMEREKWADAIPILRNGVEKTNDPELVELYENNRYRYKLGRNFYADATQIYNGALQVFDGENWGLARADGELVLPCIYDKISTYSSDRVIVQKDKVISAVDKDNNRIALLHEPALDFTNFGQSRAWLNLGNSWTLTDDEFTLGTGGMEDAGMYSNGLVPVKKNGKWGMTDLSAGSWFLEPQYDNIIRDELGRAFFQNSVFVKTGGQVTRLELDEKGKHFVETGESYEDAKPFGENYAAVKKNGQWGFIDTEGNVRIDFRFSNAASFGQHLAAVEQNGKWGYISLSGAMVIEPQFLAAKNFNEGHAPVKDENGWRILTLIEYQGG